jgi:glutathione S-transferase
VVHRPGLVAGITWEKRMITVWGYSPSGNCWKVSTILRLTGREFQWVETDSNAGATRMPAFLARNPNGKVPMVELDEGEIVTESNAILCHFAEDSPYLPPKGLARTRVMEWLFFEQYSHEPYIAVARNIVTYLRQREALAERLAECKLRGARALDVMEARLAVHDWLAGETPSIADIALCGYTQVAEEGEFDLALWPGVEAWVARVLAVPGVQPLRG